MATNNMLKSKADQALIMRSAARLGRGAQAADIINATDQALGNAAQQQNTMLQARQDAMKEYAARQSLHEQQWGGPMKMWGDLMSQGGNLPNIPLSSTIGASTGAQQQAMLQAFNQGTTGTAAAMQNVAKAMGQSPDLSSVAKLIAGIKFSGAGKGTPAAGGADDTGAQSFVTDSSGDTTGPFSFSQWGQPIDLARNDWGVSSSDSAFG
jgi:hypothetical protein